MFVLIILLVISIIFLNLKNSYFSVHLVTLTLLDLENQHYQKNNKASTSFFCTANFISNAQRLYRRGH